MEGILGGFLGVFRGKKKEKRKRRVGWKKILIGGGGFPFLQKKGGVKTVKKPPQF